MLVELTMEQARLARHAAGFLLANAATDAEVDSEAAQEMAPDRQGEAGPISAVGALEALSGLFDAAVAAGKAGGK